MMFHRPIFSSFWRFQLVGWVAFVVVTFPLKIELMMGSVPGAILLCVVRDGTSFVLTLGMRIVYRTFWPKTDQRMLVLIFVTCSVGGLLQGAFSLLMEPLIPGEGELFFQRTMALDSFYERSGLLFAWSFLYCGIRYALESNAKEARIEARRLAAELQMLRYQMNPHFLFNALNMVKTELLDSMPRLAAILQCFSKYLEYSLGTSNEDFVEVGREFDSMQNYLAVEKARFGEEILIECYIDPQARSVRVPGIIIQPLVENAIKHGRSQPGNMPLRLEVLVTRTQEYLEIEVSNSGEWLGETVTYAHGVGLVNLSHRLGLLYGDRQRMEILEGDNRVSVKVILPTIHAH